MSGRDPRALFGELRRRRVFNTIAIYVVGAWVALQVAELALPALNIPDSAIRYVWLASFALFPLVLLFGWFYDISTGGIRRTPPGDIALEAEIALSGGDRWYIGALSLLGLAVIATALLRIAQTEPEGVPLATIVDHSLAVLPFEVCVEHPEDGLLAVVLADEVRYRLAEGSPLQIRLRDSTEFLVEAGLPASEVARRLDSRHLVSGLVCRKDGILGISIELRDSDNTLIDRGHFEQGVNNFDQLVSPLATQVAKAVGAALEVRFDKTKDKPIKRLAYEAFLVSREHARNGDPKKAMLAVDRALVLEPEFADARAWKAMYTVFEMRRGQGVPKPAEAFRTAESGLATVTRQIEYDQDNPQLQYVAGIISRELALMAGEHDSREWRLQAEKHFRAARTMNPALTGPRGLNVHGYLGDALMRLGPDRRSDAMQAYEDGLALDPWNEQLSVSLAQYGAERGEFRQAMEVLDRYRQLPEVPGRIWHMRRLIALAHGYYDEDCETQLWIRAKDSDKLAPGLQTRDDYVDFFIRVLGELGLLAEADAVHERLGDFTSPTRPALDAASEFIGSGQVAWVQAVTEQANGLTDDELLENGWAFPAAQALALNDNVSRAIALLKAQWAAPGMDRRRWSERPTHEAAAWPMLLVELLYAADRADEAVPVLEDLRRHLELEQGNGNRHPQTMRFLAEVHAYLGHDEEALGMLNKAVDYHLRDRDLDSESRLYSPWARLRDDSRLISQLNRMQTDLERQADAVRAMLSRYDIDELLEPLAAAGGH
jgi:TolB-like protein